MSRVTHKPKERLYFDNLFDENMEKRKKSKFNVRQNL
jgi:hypothetical protein